MYRKLKTSIRDKWFYTSFFKIGQEVRECCVKRAFRIIYLRLRILIIKFVSRLTNNLWLSQSDPEGVVPIKGCDPTGYKNTKSIELMSERYISVLPINWWLGISIVIWDGDVLIHFSDNFCVFRRTFFSVGWASGYRKFLIWYRQLTGGSNSWPLCHGYAYTDVSVTIKTPKL